MGRTDATALDFASCLLRRRWPDDSFRSSSRFSSMRPIFGGNRETASMRYCFCDVISTSSQVRLTAGLVRLIDHGVIYFWAESSPAAESFFADGIFAEPPPIGTTCAPSQTRHNEAPGHRSGPRRGICPGLGCRRRIPSFSPARICRAAAAASITSRYFFGGQLNVEAVRGCHGHGPCGIGR